MESLGSKSLTLINGSLNSCGYRAVITKTALLKYVIAMFDHLQFYTEITLSTLMYVFFYFIHLQTLCYQTHAFHGNVCPALLLDPGSWSLCDKSRFQQMSCTTFLITVFMGPTYKGLAIVRLSRLFHSILTIWPPYSYEQIKLPTSLQYIPDQNLLLYWYLLVLLCPWQIYRMIYPLIVMIQ